MSHRLVDQAPYHRLFIVAAVIIALALALALYAVGGATQTTASADRMQVLRAALLDSHDAVASGQAQGAAGSITASGGATAAASAPSQEAANTLAALLWEARRYAVFQGIEPGHPTQTWTFNKSYLWGDIGIGPGVRTEFSGGSTVIGDCYEQPGQAPGKGCVDIEPHRGSPPHVPPTYNDISMDLAPVVQDIRAAVAYVDDLPATQTLERITGGMTITSPSCGTLNVIRVTRDANVGGSSQGITIQGCPTDYFIFDVGGQWASSGGRVRLSNVPASNVLWVFKGRLNNGGKGGWAGTAIFDTRDGEDNNGKDLVCADCALLVLNGKLRTEGNANLRWHPFTLFDYGDAAGDWTRYGANGAARHKFTPSGPRLGTAWDAEPDGRPSPAADADDADGDDEDGSIDGPDLAYQYGSTSGTLSPLVVANPSGAAATLACWIDFDRNGAFDQDEQATATVAAGPQSVQLEFGDIPDGAEGSRPMRCRISTSAAGASTPVTPPPPAAPPPGSTSPTFRLEKSVYQANDGWPDGEVEDYSVAIIRQDPSQDWGDAPDAAPGTGEGNYQTLFYGPDDNGPTHLMVDELYLGSQRPDLDWGNQQDESALYDDEHSELTPLVDDEDAILALPVITTRLTPVTLEVVATNNTAAPGFLQCWIDFDRNGAFGDYGEESGVAEVGAQSGTQTYSLLFDSSAFRVAGSSFIRCRIAHVEAEISSSVGTAYSGEVEDHAVEILQQEPGQDWGDAPDPASGTGEGNYQTLFRGPGDNGPSHLFVDALYLGVHRPDLDWGNQQNADATADDLNSELIPLVDDEDGIPTLPAITTQSTSVALNVLATNYTRSRGFVRCWIDFDRNGVFDDTGEASDVATVNANSGLGTYSLSFGGFAPLTAGTTFTRCRIAHVADEVSLPLRTAYSGEIEDHMVVITQAPTL